MSKTLVEASSGSMTGLGLKIWRQQKAAMLASNHFELQQPGRRQIARIRPAIPPVIHTKWSFGRANDTRLYVIDFAFCWKATISKRPSWILSQAYCTQP